MTRAKAISLVSALPKCRTLILLGLFSGWPLLAEAVVTEGYPHTPTGQLIAVWMNLCASANLKEMTTWMEASACA